MPRSKLSVCETRRSHPRKDDLEPARNVARSPWNECEEAQASRRVGHRNVNCRTLLSRGSFVRHVRDEAPAFDGVGHRSVLTEFPVSHVLRRRAPACTRGNRASPLRARAPPRGARELGPGGARRGATVFGRASPARLAGGARARARDRQCQPTWSTTCFRILAREAARGSPSPHARQVSRAWKREADAALREDHEEGLVVWLDALRIRTRTGAECRCGLCWRQSTGGARVSRRGTSAPRAALG